MSMTALSSRRALLVGIGALAWCGSGLGAHADDATPLRLGVLSDMSGLYADIGGPGSVVAAKMAVEDFLASPHKLKRPIEVISGDHMNKADAGANIAREWIDRDGVDVVIDVPNSAVALAVRNVVQQKNRVLLVSGASSSDLTGKSCSPNSGGLDLRYLRAVLWHCARHRGFRRQKLVYADRRLCVWSRNGTRN